MDIASRLDVMQWISAIGTIAFALSGYMVGVKKRLDLLGLVIAALLTGIGGGIIRDALVHRTPAVFNDYTSIVIIAITIVVAALLRLHRRESRTFNRLFIVADSIGLVAFSITGAQIGLLYDINAFGVVVLGFVTAVGGGVVRDMMVNEIPFILHRDFYGTVSILVAGGLYLCDLFGIVSYLSLQLLFLAGLLIRLLGHRNELVLPKIGGVHR